MFWCMQRTNIYLEDRQTAALDRLARQQGVPRAEVIRRLVDRGLGGLDGDLASDLAAIGESAGVASAFPMPDRADGDRAAYLDRLRQEPA